MSTAFVRSFPKAKLSLLTLALVGLTGSTALAQDPCLGLTNPADWPAPARPYFMVVADTSGSMAACTNPATVWPETCDDVGGGVNNSCGWQPLRVNDAKCALRNTIMAFGGEVNFGLSTFSHTLSNCPAACTWGQYWTGSYWYRYAWNGCTRPFPGSGCTGANIVVDMLQDTDPPGTNANALLQYMDNNCGDNKELFAYDATPLGSSLQNMLTYFRDGVSGHPSPLQPNDPACRSLNVILMTDGGESCSGDPVTAAQQLYNGFTKDGVFRRVYTHVIAFNVDAAADQTLLNNTHKMGQCGTTTGTCASAVNALPANNEVSLARAFSDIIASAIKPEDCNNRDDNCNGCIDEGYRHYCNTGAGKTCCSWNTALERTNCLAAYEASIIATPPDGDLTLLPCLAAGDVNNPARWLCYNPGEICDELDNNCVNGVDEGMQKCGPGPSCPAAETCNGQDDDCDGQIDNGGVCGTCVVTPEVCDGCDNDCNGIIDDGSFTPLQCGLPSPAQCVGQQACQAAQPVPVNAGDCVAGAGYGACTNNPSPELCNGIDDNCNGSVDDGLTPSTCVPSSHPAGLTYGGNSQCRLGTQVCQGATGWVCVGGIGPSPEVCDGIDNDCNGSIDDGTMSGVGQGCGSNTPPCSPGLTACVGGALVCTGGTPPQPEVCDGIDNDCDGAADDAPLADAPAQPGCWTIAGNCCTHTGALGPVTWCPPPGGTCSDVGALEPPCKAGALTCDGTNGWQCTNDKIPVPEVCDGIDNDCDGTDDNGPLPQVGDVCGSDVGLCVPGTIVCAAGVLDCAGDTAPVPEICDGLDNDCDGTDDNGIPIGAPCAPVYDTNAYPGDRTFPPCQQGNYECSGGALVCVGGLGPQPEICDGVDNDCDGTLDELGAPPNGIDGTDNPLPPPDGAIGETCGDPTGQCEPGNWGCLDGQFACIGSVGPVLEQCDCLDNDCDGSTDELPGAGEPALCSAGKDCVNTGSFCVCAPKCGVGEYPCPTGQDCENVAISGTGVPGAYCIPDFCGDCTLETVVDGNGGVACAPVGSDPPGCLNTPVCACRGQVGCQAPCYNVACAPGTVCSEFGPTPGTCVEDICYQTGCPGCDRACHAGDCVANPCTPDSCNADQVCRPSADFTEFSCVGSCAGVSCGATEQCVDGTCMEACDPPCGADDVCDMHATGGPACVPNLCLTDGGDPCTDGACCEPVTGSCGDCPCEGIVCPAGQSCTDGQCGDAGGTGGSGPGGSGPGGSGTGGSAQGGSGAVGPGPEGQQADAVWRLSTGGGGCMCRVGAEPSGRPAGLTWLGLLGGALAWARLRSRRSPRSPRRRATSSPLGEDAAAARGPSEPGRLAQAAGAASLFALLLVATGCDTDAFCFNCDALNNNGTGADAGVGGNGQGADSGVGGGGGCLFCVGGGGQGGGNVGGGGPCVETNGGNEICDGLDNDCNGTVDDLPDFDHPTHCGTCQNNCLAVLKNVLPATVSCDWSGQPGQAGTCSFVDCSEDYWDLDDTDPGCEYYCLQSADDDALCNNKDDDCDGDVDEDVDLCADDMNCGSCGRSCAVAHGTGQCVQDGAAPCDAANTHCAVLACDDTDNDGLPNWHDDITSPAEDCNYPCEITGAGVEICNGIDDDCDGKIDGADDLSGDARVGAACYGGDYGECHAAAHVGVAQCQGGQIVCTGANVLVPNQVPETCNGLDDDCDNVNDDNPTDAGSACGVSSIFPCSLGTEQCQDGGLVCVGASNPGVESCNGIDDDCDGDIDLANGNPPADAVGQCDVPTPPPAGITSPCVAGNKACVGGTVQCQGAVGPTSQSDLCGDDSNCDGAYNWPGNTDTDLANCGQCGNDCYANTALAHTLITCETGVCTFQGCEPNWFDWDPVDQICETACLFNGSEQCDGIDNDCNGVIDDGIAATPSPASVCGTSPAAYLPECTSLVNVQCVNGGWQCTFPANVCDGANGCSDTVELCDALDNDCDGLINETWSNWNKACASDDGVPYPGDGACRTTGTFQCNSTSSVACTAVKANCSGLPGGCTEQCDGVDNDCDGLVDEYTDEPGGDTNYFVKPAIVRLDTDLWAFAYEASRPNATNVSAGDGNGYYCACDTAACTSSGCAVGMPPAPAGIPLDETPACSTAEKIPWFNVTPAEAEQTCDAIGGFVCSVTEWQTGCRTPSTCKWGYDPRGTACQQGWTPTKQCNLGPYDFDPSTPDPANEDGLLVTGGLTSQKCYADWKNLQGNGTADGVCTGSLCTGLFDLSGNLREIAFSTWTNGGNDTNPSNDTWDYRLMGGAFGTHHVKSTDAIQKDGAECDFTFYAVGKSFKLYDTGFRCCFAHDPTL